MTLIISLGRNPQQALTCSQLAVVEDMVGPVYVCG